MKKAYAKQCEACGSQRELTKHHVYPKCLKDVWQGRVKQVMATLCRFCHDLVHLPRGLRGARAAGRVDYMRGFRDPRIQAVVGPYRRLIRALERESRVLHAGELFDADRAQRHYGRGHGSS